MSSKNARYRAVLCDSRGQGLAEYIIVAIIVALIIIVGVRFFGGSLTEQFESATEEINAVRDGGTGPRVDDVDSSSDRTPVSRNEGAHEGGSDDNGSDFGGDGGGGGGSGGLDDEIASLRADGVGGAKEKDSVGNITLDLQTVGYIGFGVCGLGLILVLILINKSNKKEPGSKDPKKKKRRFFLSKSAGGEEGQAMVELVLSAITLLFTILGVIQLALCLNAYSLVRYAAYNAARAAIVHGGNEDKMLDAARTSLLAIYPRHGRADTARGMEENYLAALATDNNVGLTLLSTKYFTEPITKVSIVSDDDNGLASGQVVTFDDPTQREKGIVTIQVVHLYELVIPLVNRIVFFVFKKINGPGAFDIIEDPLVVLEEKGYHGQSLDFLAAETHRKRTGAGGTLHDIEYRIPIVAHYTMRLQSDYVVP